MAQTRSPVATTIVYNLTGQTDFTVPFEYLARKYVELTLLGTSRLPLVMNSDYRFVSKTVVSLGINPPAGFTQLEIRRNTSATERLVDFHDGSILRANDLNISQIQSLHVAEEARSNVSDAISVDDNGNLDARNRKLVNLQAGTNPTDAVNYAQALQLAEQGGSFTLRQELAESSGAEHVVTSQPINGAVNRTVRDKLNDVKSFRDFGGVDDGQTNCYDALVRAAAHLAANGGAVYFPKRGTGVYRVVGNDTSITDMTGIEFILDEGVSFTFEGNWTPLIVKGLKVNRQMKVHLVTPNYSFYHGPHQYRKSSEVMPSLSQLNGSYEVPVELSGGHFTGYTLDIGALGRQEVAVTAAADSVTLPFDATSQRRVATTASQIGDEVSMMNASVQGSVVVGVLTLQGYCLVEQDLNTQATVLNRNGAFESIYSILPAGSRNQFNSAMLSVRHVSDTKFAVMANHIQVGTFDAGATIVGIAFGAHSRTSALSFNYPVRLKNSKLSGSRPLRLVAIGDSTSDPAIPCSQYDYMAQYLATAGCQVFELKNIAVSGQNSAQQWEIFKTIGLAGYDAVIANIGINDIQGGISADAYAANVVLMANQCKAQAVPFILSLPLTWYSQSEAQVYGQDGMDTANNEKTAEYRLKVIRALQGTGAIISTAPVKHMGLTSAAWLTSGKDSILMDNIHPTGYGRMMMGMGNAMAILGAINPVGYRNPKFEAMPERWAVGGSGAGRPMVKYDNGVFTFKGALQVNQDPANGTVLIKLDKEFSNGQWTYFPCACTGSAGVLGLGQLAVDPSRNVYVYNAPAGTTSVSMDALTLTL
ncbi:hypothetical protein [Aeromonas phage phiA014S]|uniref:Probable tail spike protein n=1 Tax=Aeromonas phage phiA014S TaxID=3119845 RepID=A0ABZ2CS70_9CAUD